MVSLLASIDWTSFAKRFLKKFYTRSSFFSSREQYCKFFGESVLRYL